MKFVALFTTLVSGMCIGAIGFAMLEVYDAQTNPKHFDHLVETMKA